MAEHAARQSAQIKENVEKEKKKRDEDLSCYDADCPCPVCGSPTKIIDQTLELQHEGPRINMNGIKLMGGEITKRTMTQYQMSVKGLVCSEGHRFFVDSVSKTRALCPVCHEPMIEYGSSLYSCTRCRKHFSKSDWETPSNDDMLRNDGWIKAE